MSLYNLVNGHGNAADIAETSKMGWNGAKMREALEMFVTAYKTTSYTLCLENLRHAYQKAESALAEPPRNCDVMPLAVARKVWFVKEIIPRLAGDLPLGKEVPFEEWFVAPATEKEGGAK